MQCPRQITRVIINLFVLIVLLTPAVDGLCSESEGDCAAARKSLEAKRAKLTQYVGSLKAFHREGDWQLVSALNHKIDQLIQEIREAENATDCPGNSANKRPGGLSTVKTDVARYVKSDCSELRNMLINLRRKINVLKRHRQGVLSEPSPENQLEFKKALRRLEDVKSILRARCGVGQASGGASNQRRRSRLQ